MTWCRRWKAHMKCRTQRSLCCRSCKARLPRPSCCYLSQSSEHNTTDIVIHFSGFEWAIGFTVEVLEHLGKPLSGLVQSRQRRRWQKWDIRSSSCSRLHRTHQQQLQLCRSATVVPIVPCDYNPKLKQRVSHHHLPWGCSLCSLDDGQAFSATQADQRTEATGRSYVSLVVPWQLVLISAGRQATSCQRHRHLETNSVVF